MNSKNARAEHEIAHGRLLAEGQAEAIWGWGTPAGARRAQRRGALVAAAAGLRPGVRALELGCGTGLFTKIFVESGADITANDISPELIKTAQKQNPSAKFICARFEDLPGTEKFDAIIGSSVLHHLDLDAALAKCHQLLNLGGEIAFAEPNFLNPQVFAERTFMRKRFAYVSPDETAFVRWRLAAKMKTFGFQQVKIIPFDWLHPAIPQQLIEVVETSGKVLEHIPLIREFSGSLLISCRKA